MRSLVHTEGAGGAGGQRWREVCFYCLFFFRVSFLLADLWPRPPKTIRLNELFIHSCICYSRCNLFQLALDEGWVTKAHRDN